MPEAGARLIEELALLTSTRQREEYFRKSGVDVAPSTIVNLHGAVLSTLARSTVEAARLAKASAVAAGILGDEFSRALSERALAHVLYSTARYASAVSHYRRAARGFKKLGNLRELARTQSSAMQSLIYLGQYETALAWAASARAIFEDLGDSLRLARLEGNLGNLFCRQDRYEEALLLYRKAYALFLKAGEPRDVAGALSNMAVCTMGLHDFDQALSLYLEARTYCEERGMTVLVAEADYNIAYLYFLRGEYTTALNLYESARSHCRESGDAYHGALCDLDQAEVYLELNLIEEGAQLAQRARDAFSELGMRYEEAKAVTFHAVALHRSGQALHSLQLFRKARTLFVREGNPIWPATLDLYRALVLVENRRVRQSRLSAERALRFFSGTRLANRIATCELLLARISLLEGDQRDARYRCNELLENGADVYPAISFQAEFVLGQAEEAAGKQDEAVDAYLRASAWVETLRSRLFSEDLKVSFLKDKLQVYEALVRLRCGDVAEGLAARDVFGWIEQAKSRALADMLSLEGQLVRNKAHAELIAPLLGLRRKLNETTRRLELARGEHGNDAAQRVDQLWRDARDCERNLMGQVAGLRREPSPEILGGACDAETIRAAIPVDATLLEYYRAGDIIYGCVMDREHLSVRPIARTEQVDQLFRLLRFQLSKFRLGAEYQTRFGARMEMAVRGHLRQLYSTLVAPVRQYLRGSHLIVVPHGDLHHLPFAALLDGDRALIDDFTISHAPGASAFRHCARGLPSHDGTSLVLGVPDDNAPYISAECRDVMRKLPASTLLLGDRVTAGVIQAKGTRARYLHIATHGTFRADNPMFSSLRLGNSRLTLFDLAGMELRAELVVLSGCSTGMNVVVGGDELMGLLRGFLSAGARSVLVSLWEVSDHTTALFMSYFYAHLQKTPDKAAALRNAMLELRVEYPHPYFWAPFTLTGQYQN